MGAGSLVSGPPAAHAAPIVGKISGQQHLRNPVWLEAKSPNRHGYSFREPVTTVPAEARKLEPDIAKEICIVALGGDGQKSAPASVVVAGGRTNPVKMFVIG